MFKIELLCLLIKLDILRKSSKCRNSIRYCNWIREVFSFVMIFREFGLEKSIFVQSFRNPLQTPVLILLNRGAGRMACWNYLILVSLEFHLVAPLVLSDFLMSAARTRGVWGDAGIQWCRQQHESIATSIALDKGLTKLRVRYQDLTEKSDFLLDAI